ncbi:MAG: hypothetical protein IJA71_09385, partial [Clostridia bacterium]|nr:hypothetical protein [Clostridia bacterium]
MTTPMALMDFVPVLLFGAAWVVLYRDLKNKLDLCAGLLLPLGAAVVFLAGLFKAIWKLQNAVGASPVELFNRAFFPCQSLGFVLLGVGMLAFMYGKRRIVHSLTMVFVMGMVLGNLGMSAGLVYIARKVNRSAVPLFILSFFTSVWRTFGLFLIIQFCHLTCQYLTHHIQLAQFLSQDFVFFLQPLI